MPVYPPETHQNSNCEGGVKLQEPEMCWNYGPLPSVERKRTLVLLSVFPVSCCLCRVTGLGMGPQEGTLLLC